MKCFKGGNYSIPTCAILFLVTFMWPRREEANFSRQDVCSDCTPEKVLFTTNAQRCGCLTERRLHPSTVLTTPFPVASARDPKVTLGIFGHEEEVISNPLSPGVIQGIIYSKCCPLGGEREAVLQQELVIHIGWIISNDPQKFSGMLKIRVGYDKVLHTPLRKISSSGVSTLNVFICWKQVGYLSHCFSRTL